MTDRAANIHAARVYLAQSRHFTGRRAMAIKPALPVQGDLFGAS